MVFCGQCGLQMAPGTTRCPRCGAVVESGQSAQNPDINGANDQTVESQSFFTPHAQAGRPQPGTHASQPGGPQPILLRGSDNAYNQQNAFDATSMVDAQTNMNPGPGMMQQRGGTYTPGSNYPPSQSSFPSMQPGSGYGASQPGIQNYPPSNPSFQVPNAPQSGGPYSFPGFAQQQQNPAFQGSPAEQQSSEIKAISSRGRTTALISILVGMLFILVAMVLFIMQFNHMIG
ncbi:hypothetical protein [Ktedonospora formicarum]|uniref:Zinc-ribbon domain-containing protein n=1 Tax=Ktedonospora formicarum TaxID=2778364 RepID=A0A8J3HXF7_9CHLR|nr:hypothetical protein [Ktedonospora formicarum]GHO42683.1 hypothetical protein KSX_08460 [Ktedonospora formicarum]